MPSLTKRASVARDTTFRNVSTTFARRLWPRSREESFGRYGENSWFRTYRPPTSPLSASQARSRSLQASGKEVNLLPSSLKVANSGNVDGDPKSAAIDDILLFCTFRVRSFCIDRAGSSPVKEQSFNVNSVASFHRARPRNVSEPVRLELPSTLKPVMFVQFEYDSGIVP